MTNKPTRKFEVYKEDIGIMTSNEAVEACKKVGGRLPTREELLEMYDNRDKIGGFCTTASGSVGEYPDWYWSSTEHRENPSTVWTVDFSDGDEGWDHKDTNRLSCRPVRFVAAATSPG